MAKIDERRHDLAFIAASDVRSIRRSRSRMRGCILCDSNGGDIASDDGDRKIPFQARRSGAFNDALQEDTDAVRSGVARHVDDDDRQVMAHGGWGHSISIRSISSADRGRCIPFGGAGDSKNLILKKLHGIANGELRRYECRACAKCKRKRGTFECREALA